LKATRALVFLLCVVCLPKITLGADNDDSLKPHHRGGLGLLLGHAEENDIATLSLFATNIEASEKSEFLGGDLSAYSSGHVRFELGTGVGFMIHQMNGLDLTGTAERQGFKPLIGIEGLNFITDVHTRRDDFIEWLPMVSTGIQHRSGDSAWLFLVRGGGAVGTLGKGGARFGYGTAVIFSTDDFWGALDVTRVQDKVQPSDIAAIDFSWRINERVSAGIRGESLLVRAPGTNPFFISGSKAGDKTEYQGILGVTFTFDKKWFKEKKLKEISL
jgi:hypothetical protein